MSYYQEGGMPPVVPSRPSKNSSAYGGSSYLEQYNQGSSYNQNQGYNGAPTSVGSAVGGSSPFAVYSQLEPLIQTKLSLFGMLTNIKALIYWIIAIELIMFAMLVLLLIPFFATASQWLVFIHGFHVIKLLMGGFVIFVLYVTEPIFGDICNNILQSGGTTFDIPFDVRDRVRNFAIVLAIFVIIGVALGVLDFLVLLFRLFTTGLGIATIILGNNGDWAVSSVTIAQALVEVLSNAFSMVYVFGFLVIDFIPFLWCPHAFFALPPRARDIVLGARHAEFLPWNTRV